MVVRRGAPWGDPAPLPPDGVTFASDGDLGQLVDRLRRDGSPLPPVGLIGGDLCRTLGGGGSIEALRSAAAVTARVDVVRAELDDRPPCWFVAHLVARGRWWSGPLLVAMNAEWLGALDLGPRAHPGDGLVDVTTGRLGWRERPEAARRARHGGHLPHPGLHVARAAGHDVDLGRARRVHLDGRGAGRARRLRLAVEADALSVTVAPPPPPSAVPPEGGGRP